MTLPSMVVKSGFRNRRRSISTVASITVSFLLLTILAGMWYSFYTVRGAGPSAYRFITRNRVSLFFPVMETCRARIRTLPGVIAVAQLNWFGGEYKDGSPVNSFPQYGTDPNAVFDVYNEWQVDPREAAAFQHDPTGAAVSRKLAQRYGWKLGDEILLRGTITPLNLDLHIRAIYDNSIMDALLFNWDHVLDSYPQYRGIQGFFVTRMSSPERVFGALQKTDEQFRNSPLPTKSETESTYALEALSMLGNVKFLILCLSVAATFAMLLVSANTAALSIRERVREIAILQTMGYSRRMVLGLLLGESLLLSVAGCFLGFLAGMGAARIIASFPPGRILENIHLGVATVSFIFAVAVSVAIVSSAVPAYQASRGEVVKGLRYVG